MRSRDDQREQRRGCDRREQRREMIKVGLTAQARLAPIEGELDAVDRLAARGLREANG